MFEHLFKVKKKELFKSFAWSTVHVAWALREESITVTVNLFHKHALHSKILHQTFVIDLGVCGFGRGAPFILLHCTAWDTVDPI